jgi:hypothetical protein
LSALTICRDGIQFSSELAEQLSSQHVDLGIEGSQKNPILPQLRRHEIFESLAKGWNYIGDGLFADFLPDLGKRS